MRIVRVTNHHLQNPEDRDVVYVMNPQNVLYFEIAIHNYSIPLMQEIWTLCRRVGDKGAIWESVRELASLDYRNFIDINIFLVKNICL